MRQVGDVVGHVRAARAALVPGSSGLAWRRVVRVEHEMVDDELTTPAEQIEQARLAVRPLEDILLGDLDRRQSAAFGAQRVSLTGELLLPGEQLLPGSEPLGSSDDSRDCTRDRCHAVLSFAFGAISTAMPRHFP
jgi:hypothetical protein